ncbi:MAG: glycosyltransferase family 2 protein [Acidimicrobiales bacterium]
MPAPSPPTILVCVATRNRARLLRRLFLALANQAGVPGAFEVVVTDDGSNDETPAVLAELEKESPFPVTVIRNPVPLGPGQARNRALRSVRADLVAFIDDDCVPTPGWLSAHVAALEHFDVSQGRVEANPEQLDNFGAFSRAVTVNEENGLYETCNIAYRARWLELVGGFDAVFRHSGEDADLGWRAREAGAVTTFVPDALVYHDVNPPSWRRAMRDVHRWIGVVELVERHPQLRSRFGPGRTWRRAHWRAVVAWVGLVLVASGVLSRHRVPVAVGLAGLVPYGQLRLVGEPLSGSRRQRVTTLAPALVLDTWELAVIASSRGRIAMRRARRDRASQGA